MEINSIDPSWMNEREKLVIALIAEGYKYREIADKLGVSKSMVDKIVHNAEKVSDWARLSTIYQELYS
jgi:transposase